MNLFKHYISLFIIIVFFNSCQDGDGEISIINHYRVGVFVDDIVQGLKYKTKNIVGFTNSRGEFPYLGEKVEFFIGDFKVGETDYLPYDNNLFLQDLSNINISRRLYDDEEVIQLATLLQSMDTNPSTNKIELSALQHEQLKNITSIEDVYTKLSIDKKSVEDVVAHLKESFHTYNTIVFDDVEKNFLDLRFDDYYMWFKNITRTDYSNFNHPQEMINAYKYKDRDKWSFAISFNDYLKNSAQEGSGFGCNLTDSGKVRSLKYESPCNLAGMLRGDTILKINDEAFTPELYFAKKLEEGKKINFLIKRKDSEGEFEFVISVTPSVYNYKVSKTKIIEFDGKKIGYFIYDSFTSRSTEEIDEAFTHFKSIGISQLIVDLRYNGGGSVNTSSYLLDKIAAYNNDGKIQFKEVFNPEHKSRIESEVLFQKEENSIDISNIYFLTTSDSASASELVINSLSPYMNVRLIGTRTHGKPVGMLPSYVLHRSTYLYYLINLSIVNSRDEGNYYDGLPVTCEVQDSLDYPRYNIKDNLLNGALYYIKNAECPASNKIEDGDFTVLN